MNMTPIRRKPPRLSGAPDRPPHALHTAEQNRRLALLDRIARAQRRCYTPTLATRSTSRRLPEIRVVSGPIHTLSTTRYLPGSRFESFYLIVHGGARDIELPVSEAMMARFDPRCHYTVHYVLRHEIAALLSAYLTERGETVERDCR